MSAVDLEPYPDAWLPRGIRSRFVPDVNGMRMHVLEAGFETPGRPCVLLLHGFPELAYSWRRVMPPLAAAGFHVIAPDQRGYGRTTGWDGDYDGDVGSFGLLAIARDTLALLAALGYREVCAVVGHDFGSPVAAYCALARPDVFRSVALMSAPFGGPPPLPFGRADDARGAPALSIHDALAALAPPRKHYQWYYSTRAANYDMHRCPQGVHAFLRAYYHCKSADWRQNRPHRLASWSAGELAKLPTYYVMDLDKGMPETVAPEIPSREEIAACRWLPDDELTIYSGEYERTGFQGGLNWYRCATSPRRAAELQLFSGRTIGVPACFIAGTADWGVYQKPGDFQRMQSSACTRMLGCHLVDGAGHWVQQEQPGWVSGLLAEFLRETRAR
jgi:pimeloyl-ACP methyl ester carboxylesterase